MDITGIGTKTPKEPVLPALSVNNVCMSDLIGKSHTTEKSNEKNKVWFSENDHKDYFGLYRCMPVIDYLRHL